MHPRPAAPDSHVDDNPQSSRAQSDQEDSGADRTWLAGDHHIHSRYSVGWVRSTDPPTSIVGGDAIYPIPLNALMARHYGLDWMVTTDHAGPNHSKVNLEMAYPELVQSRTVAPDIIQLYGMELDTPGADHSSFIIPHTHHESEVLYKIERRYSKHDAYPTDSARYTEEMMIEALEYVKGFRGCRFTSPIIRRGLRAGSAPMA